VVLYDNYMTDEQRLISELKEGKSQAVREWFKTYHDRLLRLVLQRISLETDAEELVQETFLNALKQLPLFRGDSSLWTWMVSIARHEIADFYRKKYAKKALHTVPLGDLIISTKIQDSSEISEAVMYCLGKMKAESVELLKLKYVDSKKVLEIAQDFGRSVKSVESELFRARNEFRALYAAYENE